MKKIKEQKLIRKQISSKLEVLKLAQQASIGIKSWSSYMRTALGMSVTQLAEIVGTTQSSISGFESREAEGGITLRRLRELADAMDCDVVYGFVPRSSIDEVVAKQAKKKALESINQSDSHMALEDQKVTRSQEERLIEKIEENKYSKFLWDKNE